MKTSRSARKYIRVRGVVICFALLALVGISLVLGESVALQVARKAAPRSDTAVLPVGDVHHFLTAAR